ncbi:MAG: hypothetical protein AAGA90_01415 [Actinomycetota bacterium]
MPDGATGSRPRRIRYRCAPATAANRRTHVPFEFRASGERLLAVGVDSLALADGYAVIESARRHTTLSELLVDVTDAHLVTPLTTDTELGEMHFLARKLRDLHTETPFRFAVAADAQWALMCEDFIELAKAVAADLDAQTFATRADAEVWIRHDC